MAYPNGHPLDLLAITGKTVPPCRVLVHCRYFPTCDVPSDSELLTKWLNDRWVEKDSMLEEYYQTGKFPKFPPKSSEQKSPDVISKLSNGTISQHEMHKEPHTIILSEPWIYFIHCFFITSSVFHFVLLKNISQFVTGFF